MEQEKGNFDHLVASLQQDEKTQLLEKIKSRSALSNELLIDEKHHTVPEKTDIRYLKLSIFMRFWYWLAGLLTGRSPISIYINSLAAAEGRAISDIAPGIFDYQENLLLNGFCHEIQNLKEAARFFYTTLDSSYNRDKGAFMDYLGSLAMPELHERFVEGSDPDRLSNEHPEMSDAKLRAAALEFIETEVNAIPENHHATMYEQARMLVVLKKLSSFLYDRLIMAFNQKTHNGGIACPANVIRTQLQDLINILFSFKTTPSTSLLSALFIFSMAEHHGADDFDLDKELQKFLQKAEKSISVIRKFNKNIPLLKIIRCATREFNWEPVELSGGEDWFSTYKTYWLNLTTERFTSWIKARKTAELMSGLETYFDSASLRTIEYARSSENEDGIPVDQMLTLSFLLTFHKLVFMPEINVFIRPILVDGEFYKKENRTEFMESYNILIKLDDIIKAFDNNLSHSGEYGKLWAQIAGDMQSLPVRRRKTKAVLDDINARVEKIVEEARNALLSMDRVLTGITQRDENSKYDTLINYAKISGRGTTFTEGITKAIQRINKAVNILADIADSLNTAEGT